MEHVTLSVAGYGRPHRSTRTRCTKISTKFVVVRTSSSGRRSYLHSIKGQNVIWSCIKRDATSEKSGKSLVSLARARILDMRSDCSYDIERTDLRVLPCHKFEEESCNW
ncbi:hypothetical protein NVP1031O_043 [Vibrio phage 1.031.O._10N.261.46.F8]|nr:hypothetical protein NVP1031O_043 [Vibrio phage 1.031.O._10N.261.46.F8]